MSTTVETTIRSHLQANDAVQETIEWAEIVDRLDSDAPLVATRPRSARVGVWVAVAAVVVTVVLLGLIPFLLSTEDTSPADTVVTTIADLTPGPRLTDDIPPGIESGTVETPAGPARWVHLNPDDQTLPS